MWMNLVKLAAAWAVQRGVKGVVFDMLSTAWEWVRGKVSRINAWLLSLYK